MAGKQINARIVTKHDTEQNWNRAVTFQPKIGEIVIYDAATAGGVPKIKIGDGVGLIGDLPFITDPYVLKDGNKVLSDNNFSTVYKNILDAIPSNPQYTDTTYRSGQGIGLTNNTFFNKGIVSIESGENGCIKVGTGTGVDSNNISYGQIAIGGLNSAAYVDVNTLATSQQGNRADNSIQGVVTGNTPGTIKIEKYDKETGANVFSEVPVAGLGSLAFMDSFAGGDGDASWMEAIADEVSELKRVTSLHIDNIYNPHKVTGDQIIGIIPETALPVLISEIKTSTTSGYITIIRTDGSQDKIQVGSNLSFGSGTVQGAFSVTQNGSTSSVYIYGLKSAAYTNSSDYASAGHTHNYAGSSSAGGAATAVVSSEATGTNYVCGVTGANGAMHYNTSVYTNGTVLYGAAWNDYAEYRISNTIEPGRVVVENNDDTLSLSTNRLMPGGNIVSDTFGFAIGETDDAKTPIAVSGRVLAYTWEPRESYHAGDALCTAPNGTVSRMTREEIIEYPDRIIGYVSAVPNYDVWGENSVKVNGRIWVKVI